MSAPSERGAPGWYTVVMDEHDPLPYAPKPPPRRDSHYQANIIDAVRRHLTDDEAKAIAGRPGGEKS